MLILRTTLTAALAAWLRDSHDDGCAPLRVRQIGEDISVTRGCTVHASDEPSATETTEIHARLAAHAAERGADERAHVRSASGSAGNRCRPGAQDRRRGRRLRCVVEWCYTMPRRRP